MSDASGAPKLDQSESPFTGDEGETPVGFKKLVVMSLPPHRETRPVTNLAKVLGQFADLQQQIAEQVIWLQNSVYRQRQDIASAMAELPELRERIDWLIASFDAQSKKDESVRERLNRHENTLATLVETSRTIRETQDRWQEAIDVVVTSLLEAKRMLAEGQKS